ncbi:MAG: hypothetical protein A2Z40_04225 [Deltaproteobacteria bacterium RBG_19FT_COMBO_60_16]|nr:MAG: hypothetical protein A2Z40_04225 [Deltaproteobacteria bacterium RBG_19FT_COMBO_60_16]
MAKKGKEKDPNIYPPEIPDPLKPGGIPERESDGAEKPSIEELQDAVAAGEAQPGEPLPADEAGRLGPADVVDLSPAPEPQAEKSEPDLSPAGVLRQVVLGMLDPGTELSIGGAPVLFGYRPGKWRPAMATRLCGIASDGCVLIDLLIEIGEATAEPKAVRFGDKVGNWKFIAE